ncbi:quinohemoprotein amine dehydrogenase subunit beta [Tropicimonas sp. IMCC34043]|uniref:quinohemoprotein amine dehydrogenase subunit beta n=1 Tax=Tropicimonas sp. IMCC34043 TaxID=2248760 RepID=UPI000E236691|nr:quinohemoprotein amine dehydrogenase subunit beta [Tropicimonas sp. IMCC34043]
MKRLISVLALATGLGLSAMPLAARDLLVTTAKDNTLYVFDATERSLIQSCPIGGQVMPGVIVMSPDSSIAYLVVNLWEDVIGIDLATCEKVFHAVGSSKDVTRKSMASLAVSRDGTEIYAIRNQVRKLIDRYETLPPEFVVFDAEAGLDAQPKASFEAPRRVTVMAAGDTGLVYAAGHDIFAIDPSDGTTTVAIPNAHWDMPRHSPPDVLAFWPIGTQNDEFLLMYSAALFTDETMSDIADFVWGYSTVDLKTGETDVRDFASFEVIMFSGVRNPVRPNELFGVYTQLSKHDVDTGELIKRVDLPHTYYVINISSDGSEVYVGGTNADIGVYDTETLERIGEMQIPTGADMAITTLQIAKAE